MGVLRGDRQVPTADQPRENELPTG